MTELQLEFIRKFGRKELSFGCHVRLFENSPAVEYFYVCESDFSGHTIFIKTGLGGYEDCTIDYEDDEFEILGHPVQWHHVFTRLKEMETKFTLETNGYMALLQRKETWGEMKWVTVCEIECDPCESPMEQPELIEQLLLLIK